MRPRCYPVDRSSGWMARSSQGDVPHGRVPIGTPDPLGEDGTGPTSAPQELLFNATLRLAQGIKCERAGCGSKRRQKRERERQAPKGVTGASIGSKHLGRRPGTSGLVAVLSSYLHQVRPDWPEWCGQEHPLAGDGRARWPGAPQHRSCSEVAGDTRVRSMSDPLLPRQRWVGQPTSSRSLRSAKSLLSC